MPCARRPSAGIVGTSRDRSNIGGGAYSILHFYLLFCTICLTPMRFPRVKAEGQGFYHCVSRVVDLQLIFQTTGHGSPEAERFVLPMRRLEAFSGIRVLTCSLMSNHFHLLCEVPQAQELSESFVESHFYKLKHKLGYQPRCPATRLTALGCTDTLWAFRDLRVRPIG